MLTISLLLFAFRAEATPRSEFEQTFCSLILWAAGAPLPGDRVGHGYHRPNFNELGGADRPTIRMLSGVEGDPIVFEKIQYYKALMQRNQFPFKDPQFIISGSFHELSGVYYLSEGHHRLSAAMEIANETGDWTNFNRLLEAGKWDRIDVRPNRATVIHPPNGRLGKDFSSKFQTIKPPWYHWAY